MKDNRLFVMSGVLVALFLVALNQTMVSTAMPSVVAALGGMALYSWVFTAYMLASTVTVPIYGKLSDLYGRRPLILLGLLLFVLGSLGAGFAQSMIQLIVVRAVQGLGAGAVMPIAFAIVGDLYEPHERGRIQGMIGAVFGVASLIGPLVGGWITDRFDWHWAFLVNVPLGLIALVTAAATLPKHQRDSQPVAIDVTGAVTLVLALTPFLLWASMGGQQFAWLSLPSLGLLGVVGFFGVAFWAAERRAVDPIISFDLFRNGTFTVSILAALITGMAMFGATMFLPLFVQGVLAGSATLAGLVTMPMPLALISASTLSGIVASRTGRYRINAVVGMVLLLVGACLLLFLGPTTPPWQIMVDVVLVGTGLGITMPVLTLAVQNAVPREQLGSGTALVQFFRTMGGTIGVAGLGAVLTVATERAVTARFPGLPAARIPSPQAMLSPDVVRQLSPDMQAGLREALSGGLHVVFFCTALIALAGVAVTLMLKEVELPEPHSPSLQELGTELAVENVIAPGGMRAEDEPNLVDRPPAQQTG